MSVKEKNTDAKNGCLQLSYRNTETNMQKPSLHSSNMKKCTYC